MTRRAHSILELMGETPIVRLNKLITNPRVEVYVKLEYFNPGGSVKDRPALAMIEAAEASGELTPWKTVIEATSGNTGIGLAMVCAVKGYRLLLAMSESASEERKRILRALGAELLLTPPHLGTDGAIEEVYRMARENPDAYFLVDQFNNPHNPASHQTTAKEIWDQTEGQVTHVVATMGTTGTLMGLSHFLKEYSSDVRVVGVEPYLGHGIQGLKNLKESYVPGIFAKGQADDVVNVEDEEAFETARRLAREEGLFVGMSSGAAVAVALRLARDLNHGLIVAIAPDGGERYLSTQLFAEKEIPTLQVYNSLSRAKEAFEPLRTGEATLFVDGPALNAHLSLEVARRLVLADLLQRYLRFRGFKVKKLVSLIDLDDRAIAGAEAAGQNLAAFTGHFREEFLRDLKALRIDEEGLFPLASEHVEDMTNLTRRLLERGYAYEKLRSVYFDISRFKDYGRLSGVDLSKIRVGKTVDLDDYAKENPRDFTLLKRAKLGELKKGLYFNTPWGKVRPSWHLECAAMAMQLLGNSADFHVGSIASLFPHEENENALFTAATGKPLARLWLHGERVLREGRRLKETGEVTVRDLLAQGFKGEDVRFFLLGTHYRKPLSFGDDSLKATARARTRLDHFLTRLGGVTTGDDTGLKRVEEKLFQVKRDIAQALDDDLNISRALSALFGLVGDIHAELDRGNLGQKGTHAVLTRLAEIDELLGVMNPPGEDQDAQIETRLAEREAARQRQDWSTADQIRAELEAAGIEVIDTPAGPRWRRR
jgi:cysteinyl-tRNA synthetase